MLVAVRGSAMMGHLQLVPTTRPGEIELKNMAVVPDQRGTGVGRALVATRLALRRGDGWSRMTVATAAADTGNLRFYQRLGFRFLSVERDAFTAHGISRCHRHRRCPAAGPGVAFPGPARQSVGRAGLAPQDAAGRASRLNVASDHMPGE